MQINNNAKIDELPADELLEFKDKIVDLDYDQRMIAAGRFLCAHWFLHWTGEDSKYLIQKALKTKR